MKVVFMGTPEFAVPALKNLIQEFEVTAVFTQPDKPKGRGKKLAMSAVKEVAVKHNIPVYQPQKLKNDRENIDMLKAMQPDFIVVVAYGQILTKEVLDIPRYGCVNLHASLLPKYRGSAPIHWAIIMGENETGNTTMLMDEGIDTGDMLLKSKISIGENTTTGELHDLLMEDGGKLLIDTLKGLASGSIKRVKQGDTPTAYAAMLNKEMAKIDWNSSSDKIKNFIRGLNPWPIAYTHYNEEIMKVYEAEIIKEHSNSNPGYILEVSSEGIKVACKDGVILVKTIQFPGGKAMEVKEFIKGHEIKKGTILV